MSSLFATKPAGSADHRVHPRVHIECQAEIRALEDKPTHQSLAEIKKNKCHCKVGNLSLGGLFLESPPPWKSGEILRIEVALPGSLEPLQAYGEVCWAGQDGGGLRFLALAERSQEALQSYIQSAMS